MKLHKAYLSAKICLEILRDPAAVQEPEKYGDDPGRLELVHNAWLVSKDTGYKYPIKDGIPVMLVEEGERWKDTPIDELPMPPESAGSLPPPRRNQTLRQRQRIRAASIPLILPAALFVGITGVRRSMALANPRQGITHRLTDSRLANIGARTIHQAYGTYREQFEAITARAPGRFGTTRLARHAGRCL